MKKHEKIISVAVGVICIALFVAAQTFSHDWLYGYAEPETQETQTECIEGETAAKSIAETVAQTEPYIETTAVTELPPATSSLPPSQVCEGGLGETTIEMVVKYLVTTEAVTEATTEQNPVETVEKSEIYILTDEEKNMLCFMSESEGNYSIESRMACMQVAINRIYAGQFKQNNIRDILFAPKQFQTMQNYYAGYEPAEEAVEALNRILLGEDIFNGEFALYFSMPHIPANKIARNLYFITKIGGNNFYGQIY